jgi:hypothetical protein
MNNFVHECDASVDIFSQTGTCIPLSFFYSDFSELTHKHVKIHPEYSVSKALRFAKHYCPKKSFTEDPKNGEDFPNKTHKTSLILR